MTSALQDAGTLERIETSPCLDFAPSGSSAGLIEGSCDAGAFDQDGRGAGHYGTITVMEDNRIYGMWRLTRHYDDDLHYEDWTVAFDGHRR